ncbi:MAG TPA: DUF6284 family protein [Mycobacteriales bacterium]
MGSIAGRGRSVHLAPVEEVGREPSAVELAAIEAEWPLIEAELAVVDAEVALSVSPGSEWAWRQHRRACRRVLAAAETLASVTTRSPEVA